MPPSRPSLNRRAGPQSDFTGRVTHWLRALADGALGRNRGHRRSRRAGRGHASSNLLSQEPAPRIVARRPVLEPRAVSPWRVAVGLCLAAGLMVIGWRVIADTAAQTVVGSDPESALNWSPASSDALDQLAERELSNPNGNRDAARVWAQRALQENPLDARALTLLGLIAERKGDVKSAETLMQLGGARTWRDWTTQSWLFNWSIRHGDYANAMPHMDAILRAMPDLLAQLYPVLASLTVNPQAFKALTDFLATSPPWRTEFLNSLSARLPDGARLIQLYAALTDQKSSPTASELAPFLNRLIKDGKFAEALQVWRNRLPSELRANQAAPFNRDFELPLDGLPFNWLITTVSGADVQIVPAPDTSNKRMLRVQFSGARVSFTNVRQLLVLPPGRYRFEGQERADQLQSPRGLRWRVFCAEDPQPSLGETALLTGTIPWTGFSAAFAVPDTGCRAQWLQLELPARIASERTIEGEAWYQGLRINQAETAGAARTY